MLDSQYDHLDRDALIARLQKAEEERESALRLRSEAARERYEAWDQLSEFKFRQQRRDQGIW